MLMHFPRGCSKPVMVKLKWGMEYKGYLVSVDGYMNMFFHSLVTNRVTKVIGYIMEKPVLGHPPITHTLMGVSC
uniref:Small nuclear ribonucleoprotein polypeptide F n=1 Tax=Takifugu rubripes TaxID=31033 RepID=H2UMQ7_TAKRU